MILSAAILQSADAGALEQLGRIATAQTVIMIVALLFVLIAIVFAALSFKTFQSLSRTLQSAEKVIEKLAPRAGSYRHHLRWGDDNGSSHVRAAMLGPSITVPFKNGQLLLGTWQQIAVFEFDTKARRRELVLQIIGE